MKKLASLGIYCLPLLLLLTAGGCKDSEPVVCEGCGHPTFDLSGGDLSGGDLPPADAASAGRDSSAGDAALCGDNNCAGGSAGCPSQCTPACSGGKLCCPYSGGACIPADGGGCQDTSGFSCATPTSAGVCPSQCFP